MNEARNRIRPSSVLQKEHWGGSEETPFSRILREASLPHLYEEVWTGSG